MSEEGPAGNFVNTHGYVHDMVTLRRAEHVDAVGEPEVENSWFKGCGTLVLGTIWCTWLRWQLISCCCNMVGLRFQLLALL